MQRKCFAFIGLVVLVASGCGDNARSRVHGTVTFEGKPLTGGMVIFLTADNMTTVADIQPDGTYTVDNVFRGPVKVSMQVAPPRPVPRPNPGAGGKPAGVAANDDRAKRRGAEVASTPPSSKGPAPSWLPSRYVDPDQSGLAFELSVADFTYNIELKK